MPFEQRALVHHQDRGRQVAEDLGSGANLDPLASDNIPADLARNHH